MTALTLQIIVVVAAVVIVLRAEPALNRMNRSTPILVRLAFYLLTLGAVAEILFVLAGRVPTWPTAIMLAGIAAMLFCERRLRLLYPTARRELS